MVSSKSNLTCEAGCGLTVSCSDRPRIGNDVLSVFIDFLKNLRMEFCVAGVGFGDVGGGHLLFRAL